MTKKQKKMLWRILVLSLIHIWAFLPGQPKTMTTRCPGYSAFTDWNSFSKLRRLWA